MQIEPVILSPIGKDRYSIVSGGDYELRTLRELGASFELDPAEIEACLQDTQGEERAERVLRDVYRFRITGFPALVLNGQLLDERDRSVTTFEGLARLIDEAIASASTARSDR